ncbi:MAG: hypothetical protein JXA38_04615 [Methanosarcinaceae archaeon]|nr:hypothetical protein [Methanosarcinaceae archaeon]
MKDPLKWFTEAIESNNYDVDVIIEMKSCISEAGFDIKKFIDWTCEQIEKELSDD